MGSETNFLTESGELTQERYLEGRVKYKIDAYAKKGDRYRRGYIVMASLASVGAAAVPVLINLEISKLWPTLLSLLVTILVGLEGILHLREHWRNYDLMKSYLWQERNLFLANAGVYRGQTQSLALFVERVESEIAKERSQTIEMRTAREVEGESKQKIEQKQGEGK